MKRAILLSAAVVVVGFVHQAKAEDMLLSCVLSSQELPRQDLVIQIKDGHVLYGSSAQNLVNAETIDKGSLSVSKNRVAFKQTWSDTKVQWDWNIDRETGDISIRYINTENKKQFLQKKGTCSVT
jgi:hypothetical protein